MVDLKRFLPRNDNKQDKEYYWSLVVEPGWVQAGIWRIKEDKAQVTVISSPSAWNLDEDLVTSSDAALSSAIQGFPEDLQEPSKTVFAVSASWVTEGQIKEEYLEKIKSLCKELSLTPIGFVVVPEALAHYVKSNEGSPLNGVIIGVYKDILEITIFKLGNLVGTSSVARSVSVVDDVTEGLTRFQGADNLPSRFLIYDGKEGEIEEVRQELLRVDWEDFENLKILHTPKIEIIDPRYKVYATCLAGALELTGISSLEIVEDFNEVNKDIEKKVEKPFEEFKKIKTEEIPEEMEKAALPEDLGFVIEKDITEQEISQPEHEENETLAETEYVHDNLKPVNENITLDSEIAKKPSFFSKLKDLKPKHPSLGRIFIPFIGGLRVAGKKTFISGIIFILIVFLSVFAFWWFFPKATVVIYVSPKNIEENVELAVDTKNSNSDLSNRIISGELLETSVKGEKTKDTTGVVTIGDKARGEVVIYRVGPEITLPSGTILYGPQNLKFTLDVSSSIASGSAGSPGNTKVKVTAQDIGTQYNLASGTTFNVGNYSTSEVEAKNETSFSGGTSREVNAVSSEDQKVLKEDLEKELLEKSENELLNGLDKDKYFIKNSLAIVSSSPSYSNKVGDEASTLKLSLNLDVSGIVVEKNKLIEFGQEIMKDKIPQGFILRGEQIGFDFEKENEESGVYNFRLRISANLLPEINTEDIVKKITGRRSELAEEFLNKEVPGFVRAELKIKPLLPGKLNTLPHLAKNIDIEIAAEK